MGLSMCLLPSSWGYAKQSQNSAWPQHLCDANVCLLEDCDVIHFTCRSFLSLTRVLIRGCATGRPIPGCPLHGRMAGRDPIRIALRGRRGVGVRSTIRQWHRLRDRRTQCGKFLLSKQCARLHHGRTRLAPALEPRPAAQSSPGTDLCMCSPSQRALSEDGLSQHLAPVWDSYASPGGSSGLPLGRLRWRRGVLRWRLNRWRIPATLACLTAPHRA